VCYTTCRLRGRSVRDLVVYHVGWGQAGGVAGPIAAAVSAKVIGSAALLAARTLGYPHSSYSISIP
jgi:hypothetical protein